MIFMFTFLPVVGILVEDQNSIYGLEHLKNANLIHICIMYVGLLLAYMKLSKKDIFGKKLITVICIFLKVDSKSCLCSCFICAFSV